MQELFTPRKNRREELDEEAATAPFENKQTNQDIDFHIMLVKA